MARWQEPSARSVDHNAAAGSHQRRCPPWGKWHRAAGAMSKGADRLGAKGEDALCRERCAAVGFKPHPSRASNVVALPRIVWARATLPAFGEGKIFLLFCLCFKNTLYWIFTFKIPITKNPKSPWLPRRRGSCHAPTNAVVKPKHKMRVTDEV